jgi:hypothetical protein
MSNSMMKNKMVDYCVLLLYSFWFVLVGLEFEVMGLQLEPNLQSALVILEMGVSRTVSPDWL